MEAFFLKPSSLGRRGGGGSTSTSTSSSVTRRGRSANATSTITSSSLNNNHRNNNEGLSLFGGPLPQGPSSSSRGRTTFTSGGNEGGGWMTAIKKNSDNRKFFKTNYKDESDSCAVQVKDRVRMNLRTDEKKKGSTSSSSWAFNAPTALNSILSSSSSLLTGVRPLSPQEKKMKDHLLIKKPSRSRNPSIATTIDKTNHHKRSGTNRIMALKDPTVPAANGSSPGLLFSKKRKGLFKGRNLMEFYTDHGEHEKEHKRRRVKRGFDLFSTLPDEMILRILGYLPAPALGRMAQVSRRFSSLVVDETLWEKVDCIGKSITESHLGFICDRRPVYFRLSKGEVGENIINPHLVYNPLDRFILNSSLPITHLDLSMTVIQPCVTARLLSHCPRLQKLSLEHLRTPPEVISSFNVFKTSLIVLNMAMCYEVDAHEFGEVLNGMLNLQQLNLACLPHQERAHPKPWTEDDVMELISNLPNSIDQLNLSGLRFLMKDNHIGLLTSRLPSLIDLDISDSQNITGASLTSISSSLKNLQHLSLSRCYSIEPNAYFALTLIKCLRSVELFSLFKESSLKSLANMLKDVEINQYPFSSVARPTVGARRSSIWGIRLVR